jgi:membrane protein YdbS with pleckstrin-like domain
MAEIDAYLAGDEEIELVTNRHASVLLRPLLLLMVAFVLAVLIGLVARLGEFEEILDLTAALVVLAFAVNFFVSVLRWRFEEVALTDRRVLEVSGLWRRHVTSVPYRRILNVTLTRGFWARLLRSGDVILDLGEGRVRISRIPRARNFSHWVISLASGEGPRRAEPEEREDTDPGERKGPLPRRPL